MYLIDAKRSAYVVERSSAFRETWYVMYITGNKTHYMG